MSSSAPARPRSGIEVSCQWSLYPLGRERHMEAIYRAIEATKAAGVFETGRHFVSHLRGDLSDVLGAIRTAFDAAAGEAGHVTAHVTLAANSPSGRARP